MDKSKKVFIFYILNYALCLFSILNVSFFIPNFMIYTILSAVLIFMTSYFLKSWKHNLLCLLSEITTIFFYLIYSYIVYASVTYSSLLMSSIELLIMFVIIHFIGCIYVYTTLIISVIKYKKQTNKKINAPFFDIITFVNILVIVVSAILYGVDFLFSQTTLSFLPIAVGAVFTFVSIIYEEKT